MGVLVLTLALSLFLAGAVWFAVGSKLKLSADEQQNEVFNFAAYYLAALPVSFVLVFFGIGG